MLWFSLALLTALSVALRDVSVKLFDDLNAFEAGGIELFWALPLLLGGCILVPVPRLGEGFWLLFFLSLPLNAIPYLLYLHALKLSPVSLTVPFLSFTPLFMIVTGWFVLHESINSWGVAGICCIVSGAYVLNFKRLDHGMMGPLHAFLEEKGSWLMLLTAFLYSLAAVVGKKAILASSPLFFGYLFFFVFNLVMLIALLFWRKIRWRMILSCRRKGVWLGSLLMLQASSHSLAIALGTAAYMIAVKRSSILISVLLSWIILKEGGYKIRGPAVLLMFCGMLLIVLKG